MTALRTIITAVIVGTFLMSNNAFATKSADKKETQKIEQLMISLKSSNKDSAVKAATQLKKYLYQEVAQALVDAVKTELKQQDSNIPFIEESMKALFRLGPSNNIGDLEDIFRGSVAKRSTTFDHDEQLGWDNVAELAKEAKYKAYENEEHPLRSMKETKDIVASPDVPIDSVQSHENDRQGKIEIQEPLEKRLKDIALDFNDVELAEAAKDFLKGTNNYLSDEILQRIQSGDNFEIIGRDKEVNQVIDTLIRDKGKNPVLIGPRGAGKTSIAQKVAQMIAEGKLPNNEVFHRELDNAYVVETTPAAILRLASLDAQAIEKYFESIKALQQKEGIKIVVMIDEIHTLSKYQIEAMKPYLDSRTSGIRLIGASTAVEYQNAFKQNPAIQRRLNVIGVGEQSIGEVKHIITESLKSRLEKKFNAQISEAAIDVAVEKSFQVYPDTSRVDGAGKLLEDTLTFIARQSSGKKPLLKIDDEQVYSFIQEKLDRPVNPLDVQGLKKYRENLLSVLNEKVVDQQRMVTDLVDQEMMLLKGSGKNVRSIMIMGPTGTGKSLAARELAKAVYGSERALLDVDANMFKSHGSENTFFGASLGYLSSDKTSGMLFDFVDDPGRGKFGGIVLINEIERSSREFQEKLMEILDTGRGTGGDGIERHLNILFVFTSNKGDTILFPPNLEDATKQEYEGQMKSLTEDRLKQVLGQSTPGKTETNMQAPLIARLDKVSAVEPMSLQKAKLMAVGKANDVIRKIESNYKIKIDFDINVIEKIVETSYQKGMGARPVEKKVSHLLEAAVDNALVKSKVSRGSQLKISLETNGAQPAIQVQNGSAKILTEIPQAQKQDLLVDADFLKKMGDLKIEMKKRIIGQDEMIDSIGSAVIRHQVAGSKRPLNIFLVGTTGTGKTETAKAISKVLYENEARVLILDMGAVNDKNKISNIFGADVGYTGSDQMSIFEKFLIENPTGGVIVFDEISNMGGNDPSVKDALFKTLYAISEEGKWTSPYSRTTYDLSKYTMINTGNDLQQLLQGQSADDLRLAIWRQNKDRRNIHRLLLKSGIPEAFLGRQADVILMKPLLKSEAAQLTRNMLNAQLAKYSARGINIQYTDDFIKDTTNIFFDQNKGARSLRNVVEDRIEALVVETIIKANGIQNISGKTILLSLADNQPKRTYIKQSDPAREVLLTATLMDGKVVEQTTMVDATEYATTVHLQSKKEVLRTAYHEAGHALVNDPRVTGEQVAFITVVGQDKYLGYARYEAISGATQTSTESTLIRRLARLLAGGLAEQMAGFEQSEGWSNDLAKARAMAGHYLLESGLGEGMAEIPLDQKGRPRLTGQKAIQYQKEMDRLFKASTDLAHKSLQENWDGIRAVVSELFYRGEIKAQRLDQIRQNHGSKNIGRAAHVRCEAVFQ